MQCNLVIFILRSSQCFIMPNTMLLQKIQFLKLENKGKSNLSLLSIIGTNDRRCAWRTSGSRRSRISRALAGTFSSSSTVSIKSKEVLQSRIQLTRWRPEVPDWWSKGWKGFRIGKWWEWGAFSCGLNAYKKLGKMRLNLNLWLWAHWGKKQLFVQKFTLWEYHFLTKFTF